MTAAGKRVDGFVDHCRLLQADPELAATREFVAQTERVMQAGFDQMQTKVQLVAQTWYREAMKAAADLWQKCVDEWGRSRGYRQAVASFSREWFSREARIAMEGELRALLELEWARVLNSVEALVGPEGRAEAPTS